MPNRGRRRPPGQTVIADRDAQDEVGLFTELGSSRFMGKLIPG
jgi:hypothetical protein